MWDLMVGATALAVTVTVDLAMDFAGRRARSALLGPPSLENLPGPEPAEPTAAPPSSGAADGELKRTAAR